jgi:nitrile hydratase beta subunit
VSGVHDLGGASGFGPVPVADDAVFHDDWERRAFAVTQLAQGLAGFNTDAFRHGIEREDPETYRSISYFDKWIRNGERMLVEGGVIGADAVAARLTGTAPVDEPRRTTDAAPPERRGAARTVEARPRFAVGERVRARRPEGSIGHTRLPGYVLEHEGVVELINGAWVYPDSHAHGRGEQPTFVYAVRFSARDLWPSDDRIDHAVHVDLFEPYLEPA